MAEDKVAENEEENEDTQSESPEEETPDNTNIAMQCAIKDNIERFVSCFEDAEDPFHAVVIEQLNERDDEGKAPLDMAAALGRVVMVRELATRGAEVNSVTQKGKDI